MRIDGGCHCGAIAYEAEIEPEKIAICHCTDCQTLSGSAFRTIVPTVPGGFRLLRGRLKIYVKTAESGNRREQSFCPDCGTPVYSTAPGEGEKVYAIRAGTARQRAGLVPRTQLWRRSALPWLDHFAEIPAPPAPQPVFRADGGMD